MYNRLIAGCCLLIFQATSCGPDFLETKPKSDLVVPSTLEQLEGLLENADVINSATPGVLEMSADDYQFLDRAAWQATITPIERNCYIWRPDLFEGTSGVRDWNYPYRAIFYANNVMMGLERQSPDNDDEERWRNLYGWAHFIRAFNLFDLVRTFAPPYRPETATADLGVPLKLTANIDEILPRSSLEETYHQILEDLKTAAGNLPAEVSINRNRPSKPAAHALASRVLLTMGRYDMAMVYADSVLAVHPHLIDYNQVDTMSLTPFAVNNEETLYGASQLNYYATTVASVTNTSITVDSSLFALYDHRDLRRSIYFGRNTNTGQLHFKRRYMGSNVRPFSGLATDEVFLIKAECLARSGEYGPAMDILNKLLVKRYRSDSFSPLSAISVEDALQLVLIERRKELVWRTLRWDDLRRLNGTASGNALSRKLDDMEYQLSPGDPRYTMPIPDEEVALSSVEQNLR